MSAPAHPTAIIPSTVPPFWTRPLAELTAELGTDARGLDPADAARRLAAFGPNVIRARRTSGLGIQLVRRIANPLVLLLIVAGAIAAVTGETASVAIIAAVVAMSVTLDAVQEHRAGRAAERLERSVAVRATVIRGGASVEVARDQLVPGDVVELGPGSLVPADGRVVSARDCFVNQALVTGESFPVEKHADAGGAAAADLTAAANAAFMGTSVVGGTARLLVCRTGRGTVLGGIGESLLARPPASAFEVGMRRFGLLILEIAVGLVLAVLLINALHHRAWLESFLFAVALAVGLTPELLPMIVTVTLSRGALRMSRERVIVKRLGAIHDLGAMDVLCTDKTGTLTEAAVRVACSQDALGRPAARPIQLAYLNSALETGLRSPLDEAIMRHGGMDAAGWTKIDEVPFDFERRRVSVLADDGRRRLLVLKGACEEVLAHATRYETGDPDRALPLDEQTRDAITANVDALGRDGLRVLGVGWKETARDHPHARVDDETGLVFAGIVAFEDPAKASAADAVRALAAAGVRVKIVTGDHEAVTRHLCGRLGIAAGRTLAGHEIDTLSDGALAARCGEVDLFCRVSPPQKSRIIRALRARGHVVGYLGDGINDAPSLHAADVGLSVDGAVDVAREAADLILLDHDLAVVHRGVLEGRRTFGNILKYLMMGTSSNFGNMFSMAGGSLFLPFLPMLPVQILVNNLLYDISEVPIPMDRVDPAFLARPHRWDVSFIRTFMLVMGPVSSLFDYATFFILLAVFHAGEAMFHTGWFVESIATQVLVIFVIRTRGNPFRLRPGRALAATSIAVVAIGALLPFSPLGPRLGFVPLPPAYLAVVGGIVVVYLVLMNVVKRAFYRRLEPA